MNHIDPALERRALPLRELSNLRDIVKPALVRTEVEHGRVRTNDGYVSVSLYSDSEHLRAFFLANWGCRSTTGPELGHAEIIALRDSEIVDGKLEAGFRYVDTQRSVVASVENEYYGNVKISVRGLCSASMRSRPGGFLHGASMTVGGIGIVVAGASGAGKTTSTRALIAARPDDVRIINDDWGWADQDSRSIVFTGEPNLHMKYRSVQTIAPALRISPELQLSENYQGDPSDPHARLLIPRDHVFGPNLQNAATFDAFVLITRDHSQPFFTRPLVPADVALLEVAEYSAFYQRNERFLDGSLLLLDEGDIDVERARFGRLLDRVPSLLVNNVSTPERVAEAILGHLGAVACAR